ncbi:MAG: RES family NAD+ phosphorylase [Rhodocyclaceae bacterium]|nr:RES family NAD+ phosphorylase [Rhodocyclaceae bacterium]
MNAWRIAKQAYALDRSGAGGLASAGRWHAQGVPVIYAGLSVEICAFEKLVHSGPILPRDLVLVALNLPDDAALYEHADTTNLPGWDASPPGRASIDYGTNFLRGGRWLGLVVPSAVIPEARNLVVNPLHPKFAEVTMLVLRPFGFDPRLRTGN